MVALAASEDSLTLPHCLIEQLVDGRLVQIAQLAHLEGADVLAIDGALPDGLEQRHGERRRGWSSPPARRCAPAR